MSGLHLLFNITEVKCSLVETVFLIIAAIIVLLILYILIVLIIKLLILFFRYVFPILLTGFSIFMILLRKDLIDGANEIDFIIKNSEFKSKIYSIDPGLWIIGAGLGFIFMILSYKPSREAEKEMYESELPEDDIICGEEEESIEEFDDVKESNGLFEDTEEEFECINEDKDVYRVEEIVQCSGEIESNETESLGYFKELKTANNFFEEALVRLKYSDYAPAIVMFKSEVEKELKRRCITHDDVKIENFAELINLAYEEGIICYNMKEDLHQLRTIRNQIEHKKDGFILEDEEIQFVKKVVLRLAREWGVRINV